MKSFTGTKESKISRLESTCEKLAQWGETEILLAKKMTAHHLKVKNVLERKMKWMQNKVKRQNQNITRLVNQCAVTEAMEALRMPRRVLVFKHDDGQPKLSSRFVCLSPDESSVMMLDEQASEKGASQTIKLSTMTAVTL